jgi:hypothetical protein
VQSTQSPPFSVVTADLVDSTAAFATSALSSSTAPAASSAAVYPGDLVSSGPQLLCEQFLPCPAQPPRYPLLAQASWPEAPSGQATGASASTTDRSASATAAVSSGSSGPVGLVVSSQQVISRSWVDSGGAHAEASSALHGVALGELRIAGLTSRVRVDVSPSGRVVSSRSVVVQGVTFAGHTASLDDRGIHAEGLDAALPSRTLAQQGLAVSLIGTTDQHRNGVARATAGGLRVEVTVPVQGVPALVPGLPGLNRSYLASITLGGAGAVVSAATFELPVALPPAPVGTLPHDLLPGTVPPARAVVPPAVTSVPPAVRIAPATSPTRYLRRAFGDPFADLSTLALLLLVLPLSGVLTWRSAVALRRR